MTDHESLMLEDSLQDEEDHREAQVFLRPILCGYCFGPKKMMTMNMVMAEASKAKLTTDSFTLPRVVRQQQQKQHQYQQERYHNNQSPSSDMVVGGALENIHSEQDRKVMPSPDVAGLTRDVLTSHEGDEGGGASSAGAVNVNRYSFINSNTQDNVIFTLGTADGAGQQQGDLRNIVRYFRSSCSSVEDSESTGTCTASTATSSHMATTTTTGLPTVSSCGSSSKSRRSVSSGDKRLEWQHQTPSSQRRYPVRVSFVPLDPEIPLEEQHGGKMDIILHKLTEDILCLSQLARENPLLKNLSALDSGDMDDEHPELLSLYSDQEQAAVRRVHRLVQYQKDHPECCLVDDPISVQTLMSRSDIADTLAECLLTVTSTSGMPVSSPKYAAISLPSSLVPPVPPTANATEMSTNTAGASTSRHSDDETNATAATKIIVDQIEKAGLSFPMIVKPLTAAGTKASHAMAVLMDASALPKIVEKTPCLCQEYANHDSLLYKVYVLGDHVSVHKRRSLPNLPVDVKSRKSYVEFDSQRPYPRLSDMGYDKNTLSSLKRQRPQSSVEEHTTNTTAPPAPPKQPVVLVTAEEVMPVVDALKRAFGLELFGFDILITKASSSPLSSSSSSSSSDMVGNSDDGNHVLMVVDVNYFPSYKVRSIVKCACAFNPAFCCLFPLRLLLSLSLTLLLCMFYLIIYRETGGAQLSITTR
jgi:inositol-1,3,4-trisphosphate 5/6-kinase/inositol-tetrakisphosphate 1-kinase